MPLAGRSGKQQEGNTARKRPLRVQTVDNTVDLRGKRRDEALDALEDALHNNPQDTALYVVHGHGTGQVKAAVRQRLYKHPLVQKFEDEFSSAGGCTVVELK